MRTRTCHGLTGPEDLGVAPALTRYPRPARGIQSFMIPLEEFLGESDVRRIFSNLDDVCLLSVRPARTQTARGRCRERRQEAGMHGAPVPPPAGSG